MTRIEPSRVRLAAPTVLTTAARPFDSQPIREPNQSSAQDDRINWLMTGSALPLIEEAAPSPFCAMPS
jgi:hypothetical protein